MAVTFFFQTLEWWRYIRKIRIPWYLHWHHMFKSVKIMVFFTSHFSDMPRSKNFKKVNFLFSGAHCATLTVTKADFSWLEKPSHFNLCDVIGPLRMDLDEKKTKETYFGEDLVESLNKKIISSFSITSHKWVQLLSLMRMYFSSSTLRSVLSVTSALVGPWIIEHEIKCSSLRFFHASWALRVLNSSWPK